MVRATPRDAHPITTVDDSRRLVTIAVLDAIERAVTHVARRHGDAIAEDVHHRLLRRLDTGTTFVDSASWLDKTGEVRQLALRAWMRKAADGETSTACRMRTGGDALLDVPDTREQPTATSVAVTAPADDEPAMLLASLRRATRHAPMTARTRDVALEILAARLAGDTFAVAARRAGIPTNTAIQYSRRLLREVSPGLQRRVRRAVRERRKTGHAGRNRNPGGQSDVPVRS